MSRLPAIALASILTLGVATGFAAAQSSNDAPPPPPGPAADQDCGPDADEGPGDCQGFGERGDGEGGHGWGWSHRDKQRAGWGGMGPDAAGGPGRPGKHGGGRMMRLIDVNGDGVIGDDEAASLADFAFMRLDGDRDGAVSEAEFTQPRGPGRFGGGWFRWLGKDEAEAVLKVRKDKFAALDADKNGNVSKAEFFADAKTRLAAADADKDGKVTPWEFRANFNPMN